MTRTICIGVFGGAHDGTNRKFVAAANELGRAVAQCGCTLIYGGEHWCNGCCRGRRP